MNKNISCWEPELMFIRKNGSLPLYRQHFLLFSAVFKSFDKSPNFVM